MNKYITGLQAINNSVTDFNGFLQDEYKLQLLDVNLINDNAYFHNLNGREWNDIKFPRNCGVGGVYFYFGQSVSNPEKLCLYIGKASLSATTGQRLFTHFKNAFDVNGQIIKSGGSGEKYKIEGITLIPFETEGMTCFAPALEEYMITEMSLPGSYELINVVGKG